MKNLLLTFLISLSVNCQAQQNFYLDTAKRPQFRLLNIKDGNRKMFLTDSIGIAAYVDSTGLHVTDSLRAIVIIFESLSGRSGGNWKYIPKSSKLKK